MNFKINSSRPLCEVDDDNVDDDGNSNCSCGFCQLADAMTSCVVSVDARLSVNVALNRPSYQSSTYTDDDGIVFYPSNANDGNHGTHLKHGPCARTKQETNPWWAVDLGVALYVYGVKFTNRNKLGMYAMFILERRVPVKIQNRRGIHSVLLSPPSSLPFLAHISTV